MCASRIRKRQPVVDQRADPVGGEVAQQGFHGRRPDIRSVVEKWIVKERSARLTAELARIAVNKSAFGGLSSRP